MRTRRTRRKDCEDLALSAAVLATATLVVFRGGVSDAEGGSALGVVMAVLALVMVLVVGSSSIDDGGGGALLLRLMSEIDFYSCTHTRPSEVLSLVTDYAILDLYPSTAWISGPGA